MLVWLCYGLKCRQSSTLIKENSSKLADKSSGRNNVKKLASLPNRAKVVSEQLIFLYYFFKKLNYVLNKFQHFNSEMLSILYLFCFPTICTDLWSTCCFPRLLPQFHSGVVEERNPGVLQQSHQRLKKHQVWWPVDCKCRNSFDFWFLFFFFPLPDTSREGHISQCMYCCWSSEGIWHYIAIK